MDKSDQWTDCRLPKVIEVNDKRTGEPENHPDQEGYSVASGPPWVIQPHKPTDGPDGFGFPGDASEGRSND